jgi:hypothetical protein
MLTGWNKFKLSRQLYIRWYIFEKEFWDGYTFDRPGSTMVNLQNHRFGAKDCDTTCEIQIETN